MYDRCVTCHGPLTFYGISIKPAWIRWMHCQADDMFVACNQFGSILSSVKKIPSEAYFMQFKEKRND